MKKVFVFLTFLCALGISRAAYADHEVPEKVFVVLEDIEEKGQEIINKQKAYMAKLDAVRGGIPGAMEISKSGIANATNIDLKATPEMRKALEGKGDIKEAAKNDASGTYTEKDQDKTYFETKDKTDALKREYVASGYAYATALRANAAKSRAEKKSEDEPIKAENERKILQEALIKEATENARRIARIVQMQAAEDELSSLIRAQVFSDKSAVNTEEGE